MKNSKHRGAKLEGCFAVVLAIGLVGCGGSMSQASGDGGTKQSLLCGTVSGTVSGNILGSAGDHVCQVNWDYNGTFGMIGTAASLDSDNMSFSQLQLLFNISGAPRIGMIKDTDAQSAQVALTIGASDDSSAPGLEAMHVDQMTIGSSSLDITGLEPQDSITTVVHGTLKAHLVPSPGTSGSGSADVQMTF